MGMDISTKVGIDIIDLGISMGISKCIMKLSYLLLLVLA